ncbi:MAG: class I SAM-dependent methyltransferase [Alphaproteobacteria bacterium]|nr:class I SAM-dependent methyltransferase [Alphaproteobacteria bacterium]
MPYSVKAMLEDEENLEASPHIHISSKKSVQRKEIPEEETFLEGVSETLLIPLYGRALETDRYEGIIQDPKAVEIVNKIEKELPTLKLSCSPQLQLGLCIRTRILDERVNDFLDTSPDAHIVNLGAGLCTRFTRLDNGSCQWSEVDLPQVKKLWHQLYEESENHRFIEGSVIEIDWFDKVVKNPDSKILFIAEGLLMYFPENVVHSILSNIGTHFPGSEILLDVVGIPEFLTAYSDWIFPDLRQSGTKFSWGGNKNTLFEQRNDLSIVGTWPFFEREQARWGQTTKLTYLYYLPGMGLGPRVIQLKFKE